MARFVNMQVIIRKMMRHMEKELKKELRDQGHKLTGKLIQSIRFEIEEMENAVQSMMYFEDYYIYLEHGVSASKIPYSRTGGSMGRTSKYITALIDYWKLRGKQDREARSAAFATANKHKQEGMPTKSSYSFSKNNRRTGFLSHTTKNNKTALEQILAKEGQQELQKAMIKVLKNHVIAA